MVVVQHPELMAIGKRGDEQVDGWESVMAQAGELRLRVEGTLLSSVVEVVLREGEQ